MGVALYITGLVTGLGFAMWKLCNRNRVADQELGMVLTILGVITLLVLVI